jgi:hypothetical protein
MEQEVWGCRTDVKWSGFSTGPFLFTLNAMLLLQLHSVARLMSVRIVVAADSGIGVAERIPMSPSVSGQGAEGGVLQRW